MLIYSMRFVLLFASSIIFSSFSSFSKKNVLLYGLLCWYGELHASLGISLHSKMEKENFHSLGLWRENTVDLAELYHFDSFWE